MSAPDAIAPHHDGDAAPRDPPVAVDDAELRTQWKTMLRSRNTMQNAMRTGAALSEDNHEYASAAWASVAMTHADLFPVGPQPTELMKRVLSESSLYTVRNRLWGGATQTLKGWVVGVVSELIKDKLMALRIIEQVCRLIHVGAVAESIRLHPYASGDGHKYQTYAGACIIAVLEARGEMDMTQVKERIVYFAAGACTEENVDEIVTMLPPVEASTRVDLCLRKLCELLGRDEIDAMESRTAKYACMLLEVCFIHWAILEPWYVRHIESVPIACALVAYTVVWQHDVCSTHVPIDMVEEVADLCRQLIRIVRNTQQLLQLFQERGVRGVHRTIVRNVRSFILVLNEDIPVVITEE